MYMAKPYDTVVEDIPSNPSSDDDYMLVYLYPSKSSMESYCTSGSMVVKALKTALEDFVSYGAADGWGIYQFRTTGFGGNGEYFDTVAGDTDNKGFFDDFFDRFVSDDAEDSVENGYGDLSRYVGCHHLVHDRTEGCNETGYIDGDKGDGYTAPYYAGGESRPPVSFTGAGAGWAPVCPDDRSLTKAAAVQEVVHSFINEEKHYEDWWGTIKSIEDDHTLGRVADTQGGKVASPMITYHWDDKITDRGDCASYSTDPYAATNSSVVTECTKEAVRITASNN